MEDITLISNVNANTKSAIQRKSAQTLPNHPSEMGYSAEEIKKRFYQPILDAANSALAEIDRVVNEANHALGQVDGNLQTFIDNNTITDSYKLTLDNTVWELNPETNMFEKTITSETHGITNYKEVGVDLYLLDANNKYIHVNQYEILPNGDVKVFHETNSAGYVSIFIKREGFIVGTSTTDVNHVIGLKEVAKTNDYNDLDNKPNLDQVEQNEQVISNIISGTQKVGDSAHADDADNATYAQTSGSAESAVNSQNSQRATCDQHNVNIASGYCKQIGSYPNVRVGNANNADKATQDQDGLNIKDNYAKRNGNHPGMTVGNATRAVSAANADVATKAQQDANGANISDAYAKKTGTYTGMTVGNANNANNASNANYATSAGSATSATKDNLGRTIKDTYATGCIIERMSINVQVRVGDVATPGESQCVDLYRDAPTPFSMNVVTVRNINSNQRSIIAGSITRQISVGSNRYDKDFLFLHLPDGYDYPNHVRLVSEMYSNGNVHNMADANSVVNISGTVFRRYDFFDEGYDFCDDHLVSLEFIY